MYNTAIKSHGRSCYEDSKIPIARFCLTSVILLHGTVNESQPYSRFGSLPEGSLADGIPCEVVAVTNYDFNQLSGVRSIFQPRLFCSAVAIAEGYGEHQKIPCCSHVR